MSNVLIGIIGVILFIGLALAGALFLGPRFQAATISSKASATVAAAKQVADAAAMREVVEGSSAATGAATGLAPGYLKSVPRNPVENRSENDPILVDADGNLSGKPRYVVMGLYGAGDNHKYCVEINRQSGMANLTDTQPPYLTAMPKNNAVGCFFVHGAKGPTVMNGLVPGTAYAFVSF
jgi:hypothetical protein